MYITGGTKKYKSIIKKKKKRDDKIVLLAKSKSNRIEVLTYKALIDSNISHDEFVLTNNVLKEYDGMKKKIKNSNDKMFDVKMLDVIKEILISEKEFAETNYKKLQKALVHIENNLIDSDSGMCLTVDSLIEINNMITGSNNITLRKVTANPYGFDKMS